MSYTKMNKEIEKYLKENGLPWRGKSTDTKEETARRLAAYKDARDFVFREWMMDRRYADLISVAHAGWFAAEDYLEPLAEYFARERKTDLLRFLCEKDIRFKIGNMLEVMKIYTDEPHSWREVMEIETSHTVDDHIIHYQFSKTPSCHAIKSIVEWRYEALRDIDRYLRYLERIGDGVEPAYLQTVKELREKILTLTVKKKDLAAIKLTGKQLFA